MPLHEKLLENWGKHFPRGQILNGKFSRVCSDEQQSSGQQDKLQHRYTFVYNLHQFPCRSSFGIFCHLVISGIQINFLVRRKKKYIYILYIQLYYIFQLLDQISDTYFLCKSMQDNTFFIAFLFFQHKKSLETLKILKPNTST